VTEGLARNEAVDGMKHSIDEMEIVLTNHETYYAIAHLHHERVLDLVKERDARPVETDDDADYQARKNAEIQAAAMVVVVFSALTLEAFINHYAIEKFSMSYFQDHLDRLNTASKWVVIPKVVVGKEIPREGQAYEGIRKVFRLRHKLVHYKANKKRIRDLSEQEDWVTENHAKISYETVELAVRALQTIDPGVDTAWLVDAKVDPFT